MLPMDRYFISDVYCPSSLPTMAQMLLTNVRDTYKHAVIDEDELPLLMNWLETRQRDILATNRRVKPASITCTAFLYNTCSRYLNVGGGHVVLIRINERRLKNNQ